jgi:Zn-finger nucleic acid-binding protein
MESLTCPKCQGAMRSYERSGVTIDQCTDCRGIFLDRGELERLIDADARFQAEAAAPAPPPPPQQRGYERGYERGYDRDYDDSPDKRRDDRHSYYGSTRRKKKRSIFEDLFD